ncbi:MAG: mannose-1-phosphate guanylyltransferase/mannose-6-phosphate isomerase [Xanthomonadales bacterium]|nr:Alginate biosynthesis protein AlgA [Xanthomonadales bacterium]MCC6594068.1 mannose-1-phosphate guanylyltransferase/mannose-6-phosphate isomerase [Xanthomonadales bacterium]MCE7930898.1 mannose-1-phosphate guanylyltransferase/mannose-6-phosphate isomerase [Xanthomonadales bacterium PRO6]
MLIPVILSGGAGTRLWPVSRRAYPKPFMQMGDGESLLRKTLKRAQAVAVGEEVITVTAREHFFITRDEYRGLLADSDARFLLEPVGRNTAPALAMAALDIEHRHGPDAQLLVLPADHLIRDLDSFAEAVRQARALAAAGYLVTFGILPTRPETGFGYIRAGASLTHGREIEAFVEKPDAQTAQGYLASGDYSWNSGMFCFAAGALLETMVQTCPALLAAARECYAQAHTGAMPIEFEREAFARLPDISVDYAVMEKASRRAVIPASFDWNDIGSWQAISDLDPGDDAGNRTVGPAVLVDARNCYVQSQGRLVAAVGVDDLVIVDTGDAVLVSTRNKAQAVKQVVDALRSQKHEAADVHATVHRPWGSYSVIEDAPDCKVKRLTVKPGQVLSLQMHHRRSEHWTVVSGTAKVRVGEREFLLRRNESVHIPVQTLHRLENATDADLHLIEVQCGDYFGEDDIVRYEDRYGRV